MKTRHLTRRGDVYIFQIRIPQRLNVKSLPPIRVHLGAIGRRQAQVRADIMAGIVRCEFQRRRAPMTPIDVQELIKNLSPERMFELIGPVLGSLDTILDGDLADDIGPQVRDATMTGLCAIGADRVIGQSLVTQFMGAKLEGIMSRTLTDDGFARAFYGLPEKNLSSASDAERLDRLLELASLKRSEIRAVATPVSKTKVPLFSEAAKRLAQDIAKQKGNETHKEVGTILRVADYFVALCGDKAVTDYDYDDIQNYVYDLAYVEPNLFKLNPDLTLDNLRDHVEERQRLGKGGFARGTIQNTYLERVRRIIKRGCRLGKVADPLVGLEFRIPERAKPRKGRPPIPLEKVALVFEEGVRSGLLADMILPLLGWTTGRRIGLLAQIQTDWFVQKNSVWGIQPEYAADEKKPDDRVGDKGSRNFFVLHQIFEEIGFIDWVKGRPPGPLFPMLAKCKNPEGAAQKRMGRLFAKAGLSKRLKETFHALRNTWIADKIGKVESRARRLQAGHKLTEVHDRYAEHLSPDEMRILYHLPLPPEFDRKVFRGLDFDAAAKSIPRGGRRAKKSVKLTPCR